MIRSAADFKTPNSGVTTDVPSSVYRLPHGEADRPACDRTHRRARWHSYCPCAAANGSTNTPRSTASAPPPTQNSMQPNDASPTCTPKPLTNSETPKPPSTSTASTPSNVSAETAPEHRQIIVDVICAYLRMPYTPPKGPGTPAPENAAYDFYSPSCRQACSPPQVLPSAPWHHAPRTRREGDGIAHTRHAARGLTCAPRPKALRYGRRDRGMPVPLGCDAKEIIGSITRRRAS